MEGGSRPSGSLPVTVQFRPFPTGDTILCMIPDPGDFRD